MGHTLDHQKDLFREEDLVWLHCPAVPRGRSKKLHRPWKGPFRILKKLSNVTYRIQNARAPQQRLVVHFNRLKCYSPCMRPAITPPLQTPPEPATLPRPPPGTNLELCDDESSSVSNQPTNGIDSSTNNGRHRYPRRNRVAPNYYHDEIGL